MKKFLVFLLFLLILAGAVFFLGWAQLKVPHGSYGVIRSKTHGIDSQIVREGEFRWLWYKLIPTNVEISVFTPKTVTRNINSSGVLPSGNVYAALAGINEVTTGINPDFSWEITGEITFSVKPEAFPALCANENIISNDDLRTLENNYARRMESMVLGRLIYLGEDEKRMESILLAGVLAEINREIETAFPELEKISCTLKAVRFPDYGLYKSVKELHNEYLSYQRQYLQNNVTRNADSVISTRLRFDELEKYGEILTRYPILMQFLALEKGFIPEQFFAE